VTVGFAHAALGLLVGQTIVESELLNVVTCHDRPWVVGEKRRCARVMKKA
jgi:hypothetical protein